MSDPHPITIPLLNPNEPEAVLAELSVNEGQFVSAGAALCTLETTKSTQVLAAQVEGYVVGLRFHQGETVRAGELLCYLTENPQWRPSDPMPPAAGQTPNEVPAGLRITQPALALARTHELDLARLPIGPLVTEGIVQGFLAGQQPGATESAPHPSYDPTAILVYGGGGHGKSLIDMLRALGVYRIVGVVDDGLDPETLVMGLPVLGGAEVLPELHTQGVRSAVNAVGGIGDIRARVKVFASLAEAGFTCPAVVHPSAIVEPSAALTAGVQVFPHAYIGSEARLGYGAIVNTGAVVSHDCTVHEYANISPGAILAGGVQIGARALVGMGVTVNLGARIGDGARVGNGATVKSDLPDGGLVRAGAVWPE